MAQGIPSPTTGSGVATAAAFSKNINKNRDFTIFTRRGGVTQSKRRTVLTHPSLEIITQPRARHFERQWPARSGCKNQPRSGFRLTSDKPGKNPHNSATNRPAFCRVNSMPFFLIVVALLLVVVLIYGPHYWVKRVLQQYSTPQDHFPGSGGELAVHLIEKIGLRDVRVELTESGDHYDPVARAVRLTKDKLEGKSLTAIAVAAHEVGHAIQHQTGYKPFTLRQQLASFAIGAEKFGALIMLALPLLTFLSRSPRIALLMFLFGIASMLLSTLVHLVTLPVEWDASFKRALPLLQAGEYLSPEEQKYARKILTAAALTYVAGSLSSLLNLARWLTIVRR